MVLNKKNVLEVLKEVYDPEIPINMVDLGLIYDLSVNESIVDIEMTLTSPGCPVISEFVEQVKCKITESFEDIVRVNVNLTFDPLWNPTMIDKKALFEMGITIN